MNARGASALARRGIVAVGLALALGALPACGWDEHDAGSDTPLLGSGGRAHLYSRDIACFGCPTGSKHEELWGRSSFSGEDPYVTVGRAMQFLFTEGGMAKAARSIGAGSVGDGSGIIEPKALPYHMTVVMLDPTVVVLNFDLGALIHEGEVTEGPVIGTPYIDGYLTYGTHVPATGTLLWFSPTARIAPTPVARQESGKGEIDVKGGRLALERKGDVWIVTAR